jgi:hypothetical protein
LAWCEIRCLKQLKLEPSRRRWQELFKATLVDLPASFDGKDPSGPSAPNYNIASSKSNDFKDLGEQ